MILFILFGLFGVIILLSMKRPLIGMLGDDNKFVHKLKSAIWFQNYWLGGLFLFLLNAALFLSTAFILYLFTYIIIPFFHLFVMIFAVFASFYLWMIINKAWQGTNRNRLKMAAIGSSFYSILTLLFAYQLVTLEPLYPGDDPFMRALGLYIGIIVTVVAFLSSFIITGFTNRKAL